MKRNTKKEKKKENKKYPYRKGGKNALTKKLQKMWKKVSTKN